MRKKCEWVRLSNREAAVKDLVKDLVCVLRRQSLRRVCGCPPVEPPNIMPYGSGRDRKVRGSASEWPSFVLPMQTLRQVSQSIHCCSDFMRCRPVGSSDLRCPLAAFSLSYLAYRSCCRLSLSPSIAQCACRLAIHQAQRSTFHFLQLSTTS